MTDKIDSLDIKDDSASIRGQTTTKKRYIKQNRYHHNWKASALTWVFRIIVGGIFILSGFSKGIDPWGTIYKIQDYLAVMSINVWQNLVLVGAFALCATEFLIGVFIILGCFRRSSAILSAIIIIVFMLPITLWIAISNPVADCGCFGEAFLISNWTTFWKNVALTPCVIWLLVFNKRCHWVITPALQWLAFVATGFFIVIVELIGYVYQPLLDFRPYKIGTSIIDEGVDVADEPSFIFIYEKNGEKKEFGINDQLPDEEDGWSFIGRKEVEKDKFYKSATNEKNLRVWSIDSDEDMTEEAIIDSGNELIITMPDLSKVSPATTWKLNSLYEWSLENNVTMIAAVSGSIEEIEAWEDLSMASYPIYTVDDTQIKSLVRGNPGVVYTIDREIKWKSSLRAINVDDFLSPGTSHDATSFDSNNQSILRNLLYLYLSVIAVLIVLSFLPYLHRFYSSTEKED